MKITKIGAWIRSVLHCSKCARAKWRKRLRFIIFAQKITGVIQLHLALIGGDAYPVDAGFHFSPVRPLWCPFAKFDGFDCF